MAADTPPPPASVFSWTGFYVGLNAGGGWGKSDVTYVPPGLPFTAVVPAYSAIGSGPPDSDGFTGGAQAGYDWQAGSAVFGIEGDYNAFDLRGSFTNVRHAYIDRVGEN